MSSHSDQKSSEGSTSCSLIQRLQDNDAPAWRELVHPYSPLIFHWCHKSQLAKEDCADIVQDVFRSVVTNITSFRKHRAGDTFRGWLRTITRNKITDFYRSEGRSPTAVGGTEVHRKLANAEDVDDSIERDENELREEHALFLRAIGMIRKDFSDKAWNAFWLVVVEGLSASEAGEKLNMSPGAIRVAKSRVLKRLREQLGEV